MLGQVDDIPMLSFWFACVTLCVAVEATLVMPSGTEQDAKWQAESKGRLSNVRLVRGSVPLK